MNDIGGESEDTARGKGEWKDENGFSPIVPE